MCTAISDFTLSVCAKVNTTGWSRPIAARPRLEGGPPVAPIVPVPPAGQCGDAHVESNLPPAWHRPCGRAVVAAIEPANDVFMAIFNEALKLGEGRTEGRYSEAFKLLTQKFFKPIAYFPDASQGRFLGSIL